PPPPNPPGLATPPPPNPPPSGIPTPPLAVPPPAVVNPSAAPVAAPVVQNVVSAPAAVDVPPAPAAQIEGTMLLSVAVRAADRPDALVSPVVRVFANGEECAEATGLGAIVVQVAVPDTCAEPGDLLSFEAGGLDGRAATPSGLAPACPVELVFDATGQPAPAYQPVLFAAEPRFATLDLADLPDCPAPGAAAPPAADGTTLTLTVLQKDTPGAPLERPSVTAYVGSAPCARNAALAGQQLVLTLPAACGQPGAAVTLRAAALDVRYQRTGDAATCAIEPPPIGVSVPGFQPQPQSITLEPGGAFTAALLLDGCPAAVLTAASAPATPSATVAPPSPSSPAATPAAPATTPAGVAATPHPATATADPTGTPAAPAASVSPTPAGSPLPTATLPGLAVPSAVPGGIIIYVTPSPR
ncbi:MAG TPA: hypothetical protein VFD32_08485, partial [Dehalococcoidia bacterium]|nr:hypothetical protein [Dehalococcoidia bacterium]